MKTLIALFLLTATLAFGAAPTPIITGAKLSQYPSVSTLGDNDLIAVDTNPGQGNEILGKMKYSSLRTQIAANTNVAIPPMDSFFGIGDSLMVSAANSGVNVSIPNRNFFNLLLQQSNFVWHGYSFDSCASGTLVSDWASSRYDSSAVHIMPHPSDGTHWCLAELSINDISAVDTEANITNNLRIVWGKVKADNMKLAVLTPTWETNWSNPQLTLWANVCTDIRAMSLLYDKLIDVAPLFTNSSQFSDGTHWLGSMHTNAAAWVNQNWSPPESAAWHRAPAPTGFPNGGMFGRMAKFENGAFFNGNYTQSNPDARWGGGVFVGNYGDVQQGTGGIIFSENASSGLGTPLYIQGSVIHFWPLYGDGIELGLSGPYIIFGLTNITTDARWAVGTQYCNRTNGMWFWYTNNLAGGQGWMAK